MTKRITGNYATISDTEAAVQELIAKGYPVESITLIVDKKSVPTLDYQDIRVETVEHEHSDETMWDRIKEFFGGEDEVNNYEAYRDDLAKGHILVSIDTERVPEEFEHGTVTNGLKADHDPVTDTSGATDPTAPADEVLQLREEQLDVDKETVQTGEAVVKKVVTEETHTIEVPVSKEELVIERKPVNARPSDNDDFSSEESEIRIPLTEEQVHLSKEPVVTEEVRISKRDVQDTEHVSDTLRKEHLDVQSTDDSLVQDIDDPAEKR